MENKILEVLLDMQKELKEVNKKLDRVEYKINYGFKELKLLSENNSAEVS
jgi:tetrahydromethanopterin S-methyltransferase subunit G